MTERSLRKLFQGFNDAGVRYLVVGGLAVNVHGYVRNTQDVDIILDFEPQNLDAGLRVLREMGYRPKVPVAIEDFADAAKRQSWIDEKNMKVFGLRSDEHPETDVDVFVRDPLGFQNAYGRAHYQTLAGEGGSAELAITIAFCSYADLVKLKLDAARPRDMDDIERLRISRGET